MFATTFGTAWGKLQNLLWKELVIDVTLLNLGNKLYLGLIWGNIACYRKCQYKEKYISCFVHQNLGTHSGILVWKFHWIIHCLNNNRTINWETMDLLFSRNLMGLRENSVTLSPLWEILRPMSTKVDILKYLQSIMTWYFGTNFRIFFDWSW